MPAVLLVDDDPAILEVLSAYLAREGYKVLLAEDGEEALGLIPRSDVVILDLMLPKVEGLEVARRLRQAFPDLPLLMLTARGEEEDRINGLELADDYVVKPFSPREVVARTRALLRRSGLREELRFQDLVIRPKERMAYLKGEPLPLSRLEFDLLLTPCPAPRDGLCPGTALRKGLGTGLPRSGPRRGCAHCFPAQEASGRPGKPPVYRDGARRGVPV